MPQPVMEPRSFPGSYLSQTLPQHFFNDHTHAGAVSGSLTHQGELKLRGDQNMKVKLTRAASRSRVPVSSSFQLNMFTFLAHYDHVVHLRQST
jgi:hypothetical protein